MNWTECGRRVLLLVCCTVGLLCCWSVVLLVCCAVGLLCCCAVGLLCCWSLVLLVCCTVGLLYCWSVVLLVSCTVGLLYCWSVAPRTELKHTQYQIGQSVSRLLPKSGTPKHDSGALPAETRRSVQFSH